MKNKTREIKFGRAAIIVSIAVILMIVFTYFILIYNNQNSAKQTGEVMINQVSGVLEKNRSAEKTLLASLKDDYIIRAKTVSYIMEHHPGAEYNIDELNIIAELMGIDEIHIFDEMALYMPEQFRSIMVTVSIQESKSDISCLCWGIKPCQCVRTLLPTPQKKEI